MLIEVRQAFELTDVVPNIQPNAWEGLTIVLGTLRLDLYADEARDLAVQILAALAEPPPADPSEVGLLRTAVHADLAVREHFEAHEDCTDECAESLALLETYRTTMNDAKAVLQITTP